MLSNSTSRTTTINGKKVKLCIRSKLDRNFSRENIQNTTNQDMNSPLIHNELNLSNDKKTEPVISKSFKKTSYKHHFMPPVRTKKVKNNKYKDKTNIWKMFEQMKNETETVKKILNDTSNEMIDSSILEAECLDDKNDIGPNNHDLKSVDELTHTHTQNESLSGESKSQSDIDLDKELEHWYSLEQSEKSHIIHELEQCVKCRNPVRLTEDGFFVCTNSQCAMLYKDMLDTSAEWRYFGPGDTGVDPTRCGMPINPLLKESSFGCKVISSNHSSYEMRKITRYTEWQSMPYKEKSQYDEFQRIKVMAHNSGIPKFIIDEALRFHKRISEEKTFRSLNRDGIIAASIYIASRINNYPRTAKEIAIIFHLDTTSATRGCKNATMLLNRMERDVTMNNKTVLYETTPVSFIERYCSKLNINKELTNVCKFIAMIIEKNKLIPENTPHSVAAGIIYFVAQTCQLNISKKDVRGVSEISEVTINKCYKKLEKMSNILMPPAIKQKYSNLHT